MNDDVTLPALDGFSWVRRPNEISLHLVSHPDFRAARITRMESTGWLAWLDFSAFGNGSMLICEDLSEAIDETVRWATTYRERLLARQHSGASLRIDPMPVPRRGKRKWR